MIIDVQKNYFEKYTTPEQLEKIVDYPSISHMWQDCVNKYADLDAIEDRAKYTYKEMDEEIALFRGLLKSKGVEKGDMVGMLVQNSYEFIRAYLAIQTLGAVAVLMPVHVEGEELLNNTTYTWTDNYNETNVKGCILMGSNGNSIFIPAVGVCNDRALMVRDIKPGMGIVMTKWAGLEEATIRLNSEEALNQLREKFSPYYMSNFEHYTEWLSVEEEATFAREFGDVIMHDNSDGGVFGSLWDLAEGSGLGFEVNLRDIPVRQETIELAYVCGLNIYRMKSSGSLLIVSDRADELAEFITNKGVPAVRIGQFTDTNDKIILVEDEIRYLERV